ncbi:MAG TPA: hypothetical protein VIU33_06035 [Nitrospiria bacterium]
MQIGPLWLLAGLLVLSGCGGKHLQAITEPEIEDHVLEPVILVPFKTLDRSPEGMGLQDMDSRAIRFLTENLEQKLRAMDVEVLLAPASPGGQQQETTLSDMISAEAENLGRQHHAPVALFGYISAYAEREGSPLGIKRPASVDFSLFLIETKGGTALWEARYHETQKSLFEDIMDFPSFFKRGGRWVTADELAGTGLDGILEQSPWKRRKKEAPEP